MRRAERAVRSVLALIVVACGVAQAASPRGPFGVGLRHLTLSKPSETSGASRALDPYVWYPTDGSAGGAVLVDAPVRKGHWPVLLFSHGSCGIPTQSPFFAETMASYGVVVVAPAHPGNTTLDLPDCNQALDDSYANRVADMQASLDEILRLGRTAGSPFAQRIDRRHVGMSGHSFGGQTTLRVAAADRRIRGALAMAPAVWAPMADLAIRTPTMVMTGEVDSVTPYATDAQDAYALLRGPRFLVELLNTGHCAFTVGCAPVFCGDGCAETNLSLADANDLVLQYGVPFLLRYVAGRPTLADRLGFRALRTGARPDGVLVEQAHRRPVR